MQSTASYTGSTVVLASSTLAGGGAIGVADAFVEWAATDPRRARELFDRVRGLNVAEAEFPAYFSYFVKGQRVTFILREIAEDSDEQRPDPHLTRYEQGVAFGDETG